MSERQAVDEFKNKYGTALARWSPTGAGDPQQPIVPLDSLCTFMHDYTYSYRIMK